MHSSTQTPLSITTAARRVGVARSTLLYYERIGLIRPPRRTDNGYRSYSAADLERLTLLRQLQEIGFTLDECRRWLDGELAPEIVERRIAALDARIGELQAARCLLRAVQVRLVPAVSRPEMLADDPSASTASRSSHTRFAQRAGDAHVRFLTRLGYAEKDARHLHWTSRDMSTHDDYMSAFFHIFERMRRQGPGSPATTLRAFTRICREAVPARILDLGCGSGASALVLAEHCGARVIALDNHAPFLERLRERAQAGGLTNIETRCASMLAPGFPPGSFDLLWAEGSAYIIGFAHALASWRPLVTPGGHVFVSDAVWRTGHPSPECRQYWQQEYADMTTLNERARQAEALGYTVIDRFHFPESDWAAYVDDLDGRLAEAVAQLGEQPAFADLRREVENFRLFGSEYGYGGLILRA
jgi:DNA-binding transcriptional MerR regulator/SAM-dependent methyltransferase